MGSSFRVTSIGESAITCHSAVNNWKLFLVPSNAGTIRHIGTEMNFIYRLQIFFLLRFCMNVHLHYTYFDRIRYDNLQIG